MGAYVGTFHRETKVILNCPPIFFIFISFLFGIITSGCSHIGEYSPNLLGSPAFICCSQKQFAGSFVLCSGSRKNVACGEK